MIEYIIETDPKYLKSLRLNLSDAAKEVAFLSTVRCSCKN